MSEDISADQIPELPSADELCLKLPLYSAVELYSSHSETTKAFQFITNEFKLDVFCPWCGSMTVLNGGELKHVNYNTFSVLQDCDFQKQFFCTRNNEHKFTFYYQIRNSQLNKVGQSPSMADIELGLIKQYEKVLSKEDFRELSKAIGLASHGTGIGSFVYLRRIFERLVEEAHANSLTIPDWNEEAYEKSRMSEKIGILKDRLPQFLVQHKNLYSIISLGIHELDEKQCLNYFPIILAGIELILDQKVEAKRQEEKIKAASSRIQAIHQGLKSLEKIKTS